eukprot:TRINITY_DN1216_c0_g1_i1.p1 TRINITY_DN1216_c0_g1~~TRINITY_DN1216_c0_g1_i1.p1  ORF type:complete len:158 (-),score=28.18 TRINITY_DN1216_c0_g1_i1:36-509(-)
MADLVCGNFEANPFKDSICKICQQAKNLHGGFRSPPVQTYNPPPKPKVHAPVQTYSPPPKTRTTMPLTYDEPPSQIIYHLPPEPERATPKVKYAAPPPGDDHCYKCRREAEEGTFVQFSDRKYHWECFLCSKCGNRLNTNSFRLAFNGVDLLCKTCN